MVDQFYAPFLSFQPSKYKNELNQQITLMETWVFQVWVFFTQLKKKNPKKHTSSLLPLVEDIGLDLYPPISKYQLLFEETQGIYLQNYLDCC